MDVASATRIGMKRKSRTGYKARKAFSRTASRTRKENVTRYVMRGGTRL
jgi:hypothetical protein